MMKGSWKTTYAAISTGLGSIAMIIGEAMKAVDGGFFSNLDFQGIVMAVGLIFVGLKARDNDVSSEDAGAK